MAGWLTHGKRKYESLDSTMRELLPPLDSAMMALLPLVDDDSIAYDSYMVRYWEKKKKKKKKKKNNCCR